MIANYRSRQPVELKAPSPLAKLAWQSKLNYGVRSKRNVSIDSVQSMRMKLPRLRISLRAFLVGSVVVASGVGFLLHRYVSERAAEAKLVANGFSVSFEPWGGNGQYWAYSQDHEQAEAFKSFAGRLKWEIFRHAKYVSGQRSAQLSEEPSEIGDESLAPLKKLRHVEMLYLGFQPITDEGLGHLRNLKSLMDLNLCGTQITDHGLSQLTGLSNLEYLALEFTDVSDAGLQHLARIRSLREIALMGSKLTGPGLEHIGTLRHLESLGISDMPVSSDALRHIAGLKNLKTLYLSNTEIDDSAATHIATLISLETLWVDDTIIGDDFIEAISSLPNISNLNVAGTQITNASEAALKKFRRLEQFYAVYTAMDYDTIGRIEVFTDANTEEKLDGITY